MRGMERADSETGQLVEAIYDAAADPAGWSSVMAGIGRIFRTRAETFYYLGYADRAFTPVHIAGIDAARQAAFPEIFYTPDNPCTRSDPLHRPGVLRTDERLAEFFGDPHVLRRSTYYNEWMRPQRLDHTMGTSFAAGDGLILNLSLLRGADVGVFDMGEFRRFAGIVRHMDRALRMAARLETLTAGRALVCDALDHLPYGVAFAEPDGRLVQCNARAEALLRRGDPLTLRNGRLAAASAREADRLAHFLGAAADPAGTAPPARIAVRGREGRPLVLSAARIAARRNRLPTQRPVLMLTIAEADRAAAASPALYRDLYGFTPVESRLAAALLPGTGLKRAAEAAGITYETARWYLKAMFQKTGTTRQSELVARLTAAAAARLLPPGDDPDA
ncbi:DNA-binding CsgD family transcriptional regulator/PAS domain-containing protein [Constrictibacter sp. MBR-5]